MHLKVVQESVNSAYLSPTKYLTKATRAKQTGPDGLLNNSN